MTQINIWIYSKSDKAPQGKNSQIAHSLTRKSIS